MLRRVTITLLVVGVSLGRAAPSHQAPGWALYDRYCLACHGTAGDGRGPAAPYVWPRPRDLTRGELAWRSTPAGQSATREDIVATMRFGVGTSMPGFDRVLSPNQLGQLVDVVRGFGPPPTVMTRFVLPPAPAPDAARGAQLWSTLGCVACHGGDGRGNATLKQPPYDLTSEPLRRPRAGDPRRAAALSIATGVTAMPAYGGTIGDADLWALADHVLALNAHAVPRDPATLATDAIAADRTARIATGRWPGTGDEAVLFGGTIEPQGPPPPTLAPAEASLDAQQCARCHAKQFREWRDSLHGAAASPGLLAQIDYLAPAEAASCRRCHAPLAEQAAAGPLRDEGVACASCHVRNWTRRGPPNLAPSLLPDPSYPFVALPIYERADFCLPCHQLAPRDALAGRPLLNTYAEWLEGPYMRRGIQCQHCHMPNREHQFLGIHDPATLEQGLQLVATARKIDRSIAVVAELRNVGAGHYLPTTPTPALWLVIELVDERDRVIDGATARLRIGRDLVYDAAGWHEREDTRIAPGEQRMMARAWSGGRTAQATHARVTVEVHPDDYYEHFYEAKLALQLPAPQHALYQQALDRARRSRYRGEQIRVAIAP